MRYTLSIEKRETTNSDGKYGTIINQEHFLDAFLNANGKEFNIDNAKISNTGESTSYQIFKHITDNISEFCKSDQKYHITTDGKLFRVEENHFPQAVELYERHLIEKDLYNYFVGEFEWSIDRTEGVQND